MGEHAKFNGEQIKIGTCENMYYLRADQAHLVQPESHSLDPILARREIRFRFPFPNEDKIAPGDFKDHDRGIAVPGMAAPADVGHTTVQFRHETSAGCYLTSLPCPEGPQAAGGPKIHRNGFAGAVRVVQQKWIDGSKLATVCECTGCGARWRVESEADVKALVLAFSNAATGADDSRAEFYLTMADRIAAGYDGRQGEILQAYATEIERRMAMRVKASATLKAAS